MTNSELGLIMLTNDPDGILRKSADMVDLEDIKNIQELIDLMLKKTYELGAMGLAAPQIGISKQIFVLSLNKKNYFNQIVTILNFFSLEPENKLLFF